MPFLKERRKLARSRQLENLTKRNGLRHAIFNTVGDKYVGEWQNDLKTGKGVIMTKFRELYEGDLLEGYRHGFGVLARELENKSFFLEYRGNWWKGRMDRTGMKQYVEGGVFVGDWKRGGRHGYGLMWYPNGDFYAGYFLNDKKHGLGMLVKANGNRYEGSWFEDFKHGKGRYLHLNTGQMQTGVWVRDICVHSTLVDISYRQSAIRPTPYPIQKIEVINANQLCSIREEKALLETKHSCLSLHDTASVGTSSN